MNLSNSKHLLLAIGLMALITACDQNKIYDTYVDLEDSIWHQDTLTSYNFSIEDAALDYDISYNIRYAEVYPYYNIYVKYYLEDSTSTIIQSELQEIILFDKKSGTPLGNGLGDIFDRQVLIFENFKFPADGNYTFKIKQFMRTENLPGIMSFGLRIDKPEEDN
ncbi:MAG: gliding motility-associated lipoprotein GldH [Cyclobacteriaceae bacterium]|jgi:gliding motility-associated lipoprotein GldH